MKETRPLILRTTTKEEIRFQKIGNGEKEGQRRKGKEGYERWEMKEVVADG